MICKNVALIQNPWENKLIELVKDTEKELLILSPFIKKDIIEEILDTLKGKELKIILKTSIYDISNGVFDIDTLTLLNKYGAEIRSIKNLHAKMFIFDGNRAILTSSNLTKAGLNSNIEFGILLDDADYVKEEILPVIDTYWANGKIIGEEEIMKIKNDVMNFNDLSKELFINDEEIGDEHSEKFVKPVGQDSEQFITELSKSKKYEKIANKLMLDENLSKKQILSIVKEYFHNHEDLYHVLKGGLSFSFRSDNPFTTASIYTKNVSKFYPDFKESTFYRTNAKMFKNMILGKSKNKIVIRNIKEYRKVQKEFYINFHIKPPKSINVFNAILEDKKGIKKIASDPIFYLRIINIFHFIDPELLKEVILKQYEEEIKYLNLKKQPEVRDNIINGINKVIDEIERKKKIVEQN